jgi:hypothetical protein
VKKKPVLKGNHRRERQSKRTNKGAPAGDYLLEAHPELGIHVDDAKASGSMKDENAIAEARRKERHAIRR